MDESGGAAAISGCHSLIDPRQVDRYSAEHELSVLSSSLHNLLYVLKVGFQMHKFSLALPVPIQNRSLAG